MYLATVLSKTVIIHSVCMDFSLHQPMYYFLTMLVGTDLAPKVLGLLWLNFLNMHLYICVFQPYFVYTFSFIESAILLAMAYDSSVAITISLRYPSSSHQLPSTEDWSVLGDSSCISHHS